MDNARDAPALTIANRSPQECAGSPTLNLRQGARPFSARSFALAGSGSWVSTSAIARRAARWSSGWSLRRSRCAWRSSSTATFATRLQLSLSRGPCSASNSAMASASATPGSPRSIASSAALTEATYSGALAST